MEQIISQLIRQAQDIERIKQGENIGITLKAAGTMLDTNFTGSGYSHVTPEGLPPISIAEKGTSKLFDLFPKVQVGSHSLVLSNQVIQDSTTAVVAQDGEKPLFDFDVNATNLSMTKYAVYATASDELLSDIGYMNNLIQETLKRRLKLKIAQDLIVAIYALPTNVSSASLPTGTGSTGLFKDMFPPIYSTLTAGGYEPNLWLLQNADYSKLFNEEATNLLWFAMNEPNLLPQEFNTDNKIVALNTNLLPIYVYKDINIQVGKTGDDFKLNQTSIRCEARVGWSTEGELLNAMYLDTISATLTQIA